MASVEAERAAFDELAGLLRRAAVVDARALADRRGTPAENAVAGQLGHTLDRLALLYGRGTYENLDTAQIVGTAMDNELRLAVVSGPAAAAAARDRAQALLDAARRGVSLHVRAPTEPVALPRGVYVTPLREDFERSLWALEQPYLRFGDGALVILDDTQLAALRAEGDEVDVLFLDSDELADLSVDADRDVFAAEVERRLAVARASADGVGDSRDRYVLRLLLQQTVVLRNLRDRLAGGHPGAHQALLPILAAHTDVLAARLTVEPTTDTAQRDPLGASIAAERELRTFVTRWAAEPGDPARLRDRFRAVADAGTRLAELERHHT